MSSPSLVIDWRALLPLLAGWLLGSCVTDVAKAAPLDARSEQCQECHETEDFSVGTGSNGERLSLTVRTAAYLSSVHGRMACVDCHDRGYERHPHSGPRALPSFFCVDCHADDPRVAELDFPERKADVLRSVHGREAQHPLQCHDCHDPHTFRLVSTQRELRDGIRMSNALCLECHDPKPGQRAFAGLTSAVPAHRTIPNPRDHMRKVKCVACHTPFVDNRTHEVLGSSDAQANCTQACHGEEAKVLRALYVRDRNQGERTDPLQRDAYVIGASRTPMLDRLSLIAFAMLLVAIAVHAMARALAAWRRRRA